MKVLAIESVKLFQCIISNLFESNDISVIIKATGEDALTVLNTQDIDVICVSMYLPDTDGIALSQKIRQLNKYKHIPIILFTSEESPELLTKAMSIGVTEIFNKKDIQQLVIYIKRFTIQHQNIDAKILYVEDMLSQRAVITAFFEELGIQVDGCSSGEEAWEKIQQNSYDLVVTDIILEGNMSGIGLVNNIRRMSDNKGDMPILAVTGFDDISRRIELFHLGVNDYVIKPVIQQEIIARVRNLISLYRATQDQANLVIDVFKKSTEGVFMTKYNKTISSVNKAFVKITGFSEVEVLGKSPMWISTKNTDDNDEIWKSVDNTGSWEGKVMRKHKDGTIFSAWLNLISIKNPQDIITHYIGRIHSYKER